MAGNPSRRLVRVVDALDPRPGALLTGGGVLSLFDQVSPGAAEIVRSDHR